MFSVGLILSQKHITNTFPFGRFVFNLVSVIWFHGNNNASVNNGAETESAEFGALEQQNISDDSQLDGGIFPHKCCKDTLKNCRAFQSSKQLAFCMSLRVLGISTRHLFTGMHRHPWESFKSYSLDLHRLEVIAAWASAAKNLSVFWWACAVCCNTWAVLIHELAEGCLHELQQCAPGWQWTSFTL